eukprot:56224_1
MSNYALIVGGNGYSVSTVNNAFQEALDKYRSTNRTISCIALGPSNYFAVICNSNVKKNSTYVGGEHFMKTMQNINKRDVKQISFGPVDQYAITLKNGTCHAYLVPGTGVLEAINQHLGNIKYVSLCGVQNVWIVGYAKNDYVAGSLVSKALTGFLDGIKLANKTVKFAEVGDSHHYFVQHSHGNRFQLPQALSEFYHNTTSSFSSISLYSEGNVQSIINAQYTVLQNQFSICKTQKNALEMKYVEVSDKNEKLEKEIKKLKGLDVKAMNLNDLYQLKEIVTNTVSRLEKEIEKKHKNHVLCITCLDKNQEVFFEPCHHMLMCQECSNKLTNNKCPVCQTPIRSKIMVFRS